MTATKPLDQFSQRIKEGAGILTEVPGDYIQRDMRQYVLHLLGHFGDAAIVCGQTLHHEAEAHGGGSGT